MSLVFQGFSPDEEFDVEIARPDRRVERTRVRRNEHCGFRTQPSDPLGVYTVTATQTGARPTGNPARGTTPTPTERRITGTVEVRATGVHIYWPVREGPAGTALPFTLVNYPKNQTITVHVYRREEPDPRDVRRSYWYVSTLPPVRTDERGNATVTIATARDDQPGTYLLRTQPGEVWYVEASFEITEPSAAAASPAPGGLLRCESSR